MHSFTFPEAFLNTLRVKQVSLKTISQWSFTCRTPQNAGILLLNRYNVFTLTLAAWLTLVVHPDKVSIGFKGLTASLSDFLHLSKTNKSLIYWVSRLWTQREDHIKKCEVYNLYKLLYKSKHSASSIRNSVGHNYVL